MVIKIGTCPPTSHTVKLMFLYSTVSTLNPTEKTEVKIRHAEIFTVEVSLTDSGDSRDDFS